ncbi:MAG: serine/threonine-protein kinase [Pseudomonadota bacterium]
MNSSVAVDFATAPDTGADRFDFGDSTEGLLNRLKQLRPHAGDGHGDSRTLTLLLDQTRTEIPTEPMDLGRPRVATRPSISARVGDVIKDRFVLEQQIGRGGMGQVFKALDKRQVEARSPSPYVAVKVMAAAGVDVEEATVAMAGEVQRAQTLSHPHIVRVNDFDRDGDTVFATMELLEGTSLRERIDTAGPQGIGGQLARRIIRQSAEALAYAHANGILHADFKPSNVFVTKRGEVKVIDFGIARAYYPETLSAELTSCPDAQRLRGLTPSYASPEMLELQTPDPRDDVYALGCVAYEIFTGQHPFGRRPATQARDLGEAPTRPAQLNRREWAALKGTLSFDRATRTRSVREFLMEFCAVGSERVVPTRPSMRIPLVAATALLGTALWLPMMGASGNTHYGSRLDTSTHSLDSLASPLLEQEHSIAVDDADQIAIGQ